MRAGFRSAIAGLGVTTAVIAAVVFGAFITYEQGCFIGSRPPASEPPWYTIYLERPMLILAPATVLLVGGFAALGARRVSWRIVGLALTAIAAFSAFFVMVVAMPSCT
jgi:hypothetical protein